MTGRVWKWRNVKLIHRYGSTLSLDFRCKMNNKTFCSRALLARQMLLRNDTLEILKYWNLEKFNRINLSNVEKHFAPNLNECSFLVLLAPCTWKIGLSPLDFPQPERWKTIFSHYQIVWRDCVKCSVGTWALRGFVLCECGCVGVTQSDTWKLGRGSQCAMLESYSSNNICIPCGTVCGCLWWWWVGNAKSGF